MLKVAAIPRQTPAAPSSWLLKQGPQTPATHPRRLVTQLVPEAVYQLPAWLASRQSARLDILVPEPPMVLGECREGGAGDESGHGGIKSPSSPGRSETPGFLLEEPGVESKAVEAARSEALEAAVGSAGLCADTGGEEKRRRKAEPKGDKGQGSNRRLGDNHRAGGSRRVWPNSAPVA